jgi:hypothetical protein
LAEESRSTFAPSARRPEKGSLFVGCAIGCGVLVLVAVVSVLVFLWWLLAPITIPKPQSVMLPEAQSFVVARLDPNSKPVLDLIGRVVEGTPELATPQAKRPPWALRWLLGADDPVHMAQKFLPIQAVFSDDPATQRTVIVFSAGRGRGVASLARRALNAKAQEKDQEKNFRTYQGQAIVHGEGDTSAWWFTIADSSLCTSNGVEGAKEIIDMLGKGKAESASDVVKLYTPLSEGAVVCGASTDEIKMRQAAAWLLASVGKPGPPVQLQGVKRATFKVSLTEQMTVHTAIELTCVNAQVAQGMQKGLQTSLMPKQLEGQISAVRVLDQDEKIYLDFDVPQVDKLIIAAIKEKQRQDEQKKAETKPESKPEAKPAPKEEKKPAAPEVKKEAKPAAPPATKGAPPAAAPAAAPAKGATPPAAPKKAEPAKGAAK